MLHRIWVILHKEYIHVSRAPRTLFLVIMSPTFMLIMLSYLFTLDFNRFVVSIFDQDKTPLSRQYITALSSDDTVQFAYYLDNHALIDELLLTNKTRGAVVIPPGFGDELANHAGAPVQVILDGTNPNLARQLLGQLTARTQLFAANHAALAPHFGIDIRTRVFYNPNVNARQSMVPGLIAVVMCMPIFSMTTALAREKELGTFESLVATPLRGLELLLGKLLFYTLSGLISALLAVAIAVFWFDVSFRGNLFLFMLLTIVYLWAALGMSLLLANFLDSQQAATTVVFILFFVPGFFLTGLFDPIVTTSWSAALKSYILPTTHYVAIIRGIFLKGVGWRELIHPIKWLLSIGAVCVSMSLMLFKKRM